MERLRQEEERKRREEAWARAEEDREYGYRMEEERRRDRWD